MYTKGRNTYHSDAAESLIAAAAVPPRGGDVFIGPSPFCFQPQCQGKAVNNGQLELTSI